MLEVSRKFKKAVYAPARTCSAKVRFEILDTTAFSDNNKTVSSEAVISRKDQLTNKVRSMTNKYAVFEKNYLKLDGSFIIPPKPSEMIDNELGWWSGSLCDSAGAFSPYEVLEFNFTNEHSSAGLTLYFDILNNEYATNFDIDVYGTAGLIKHYSAANNTDSRYIYISQLSDYKRIVITIKKWCKGYRRVKITEVDFGIIKEYTDSNLIKLNVLQELDTTSSTLPSDELKFTVDNSNREFNVLNPTGFYAYLQQGQECFVDIGVMLEDETIEYIPVRKHYLKRWQSDEGTLTTTFTARDILDSLSNTEVENNIARNITLYDLAVEVMEASNIESYVLSNNLKLIKTKGLHKKISYRSLLQLIAIAGMCVAYSDNLGTFHTKQLISAKAVIDSINVTNAESISNKNQVINNILEPSFNLATFEKDRFKLDGSFVIPQQDMSKYEIGWWSSKLCSNGGIFATPLKLEINLSKDHNSKNFEILFDALNNEYAANFDLKIYDSTGAIKINETIVNSKARFLYENNLLENCRKIEIVIKKWCKGIRRARVVEIGFDLPMDNITFDNIYKEPQIELGQAIKSVEVTYYPTDLEKKATYTAIDNSKEGSNLKLENSLINNETDAKNVADWILKESNNRVTFKVDWRGNPALNLTDKVSIENGYGTNNIANITKQELTYQGYLGGKTEGKGVI
ncbi:hypothetical protein [Clostridium algidicarnis]|uniref:hypothetical protein n=1 Tax=Clostridium algidicarnis TaxID=37659 RepID=UPI001C0AB318|nr:hypothetical protein [Clostridium algidicarnis]MBU3226811.1 hypothetical protein [Clostridium algidicarnis]MBU3250278.1 hypothetical protein [Clostridium algidicarnis]